MTYSNQLDRDLTADEAHAREVPPVEVTRKPRSDDELFAYLVDELECRRRNHVNAKHAAEQASKECAAAEIALEICKRTLEALSPHPAEQT